MTRLGAMSLSVIVALIGPLAVVPAHAQEIWLAPNDAVDRIDMFKPDAPWKNAAAHTQVFKFYANKDFNSPPQEAVDAVVGDMNRRGIAVALEAGVMNVGAVQPPGCGGWGSVEGYGPVAMHEVIARKIKKAGGVVKYVAMDEPLWYGHYFKGGTPRFPHRGCQSSIGEVASLVAPSLAVYIREFPSVIIGDIEPSNALANQPDWQRDLTAWGTAFRAAVGRPLAFLQLDAAWAEPQAAVHARLVYQFAQQHRGLFGKIGMIYNGNPNDPSDAAWVQSARDHVLLIERDFGLHPDQAVFQSWHPHPTHTLPETSPDTLTSLVDFYVTRKSGH
ncbi:MAG TPA: hypothetical protein VGJ20_14795 [Xanthobacteraceae bacterium]|jgi:hypothetical protein